MDHSSIVVLVVIAFMVLLMRRKVAGNIIVTGLMLLVPWNGHGLSQMVVPRRDAAVLLLSLSSPWIAIDAAAAQAPEDEERQVGGGGIPPVQPRRPYAPIEALVPAIRVALQIEQSFEIATKNRRSSPATTASSSTNDVDNADTRTISQLRTIWIDQPVDYFAGQRLNKARSTNNKVGNNNGDDDKAAVVGSTFVDRYERNRRAMSMVQRPGALLVERGEINAWQNLRRRERRMSQTQPARAAMNYYTDALRFDGTSYVLTAPPDERSRLIRNDRLPDINQVVTADLDLRYLYRNQVLTNLDDVVAELQQSDCDLTEVVVLLTAAHTSMGQWLDFIDPNDVQAARSLARLPPQQQQQL
jgi:hypothetical protein